MSEYRKEKNYFTKTPITYPYRDDIQYLIHQEDGYEINFLYQQLIGLTANKDGKLVKIIGDKIEPYSIDELALKTMHDKSIIDKGLKILEDIKLLTKIDDYYFVEEAIEMTTNQTEGAKKKKEQRERAKEKNKVDNCTAECPPYIEEDKEKEIRKENRNKNIEIEKEKRNRGDDIDEFASIINTL